MNKELQTRFLAVSLKERQRKQGKDAEFGFGWLYDKLILLPVKV